MESIRQKLENSNWKVTEYDEYFGVVFDIIGFRTFHKLVKWNILIKRVNVFNVNEFNDWSTKFKVLSKKSKVFLKKRCFVLCIIADEITVSNISGFTSLANNMLFKKGGGSILVRDLNKNKIYGKIPKLPIDVHKYTKFMYDVLSEYQLDEESNKVEKTDWKSYKGGWGVFVEGGTESDHLSITNEKAKVGKGFHITVGNNVRVYFDNDGNFLGEGMKTSKLLEKLNDLKNRGIITNEELANSYKKISDFEKKKSEQ